jgi:rare lipoprotein A
MLDLSRAAAEKLGVAHSGVATVHARVVSAPSMAEATYLNGRKYAPVPGYIGRFGTLELAMADAAQAHGLGGLGTSVAAATPPGPMRKPASTMILAGLPPDLVAGTGGAGMAGIGQVAGVVAVAGPPLPQRPTPTVVADARDRLVAARRTAEQRVALAVLAEERARVAAARELERRERVAQARAEKAKARRLAEAQSAAQKKRQQAAAEDDDGEAKPGAKRASSGARAVVRPVAVAEAEPVAQPAPDMSWVKVALTIQ